MSIRILVVVLLLQAPALAAQELEEEPPLAPVIERAGWTPVQLALFAPLQIFPGDYSVAGMRLNLLYGRNVDVLGLDLGLFNRATGVVGPLQIGFRNETGHSFGLQASLWGNVARGSKPVDADIGSRFEVQPPLHVFGGDMLFRILYKWLVRSNRSGVKIAGTGKVIGAQLSLGFNSGGDVYGVQCCAVIQSALYDMYGLQVALMYNFAEDVVGAQLNLLGVNKADHVVGLQATIGLNDAGTVYGFQIGTGNSASRIYGFQVGLFNLGNGIGLRAGLSNQASGDGFFGLQVGLSNSGSAGGIDVGLMNRAHHALGLQLGLYNDAVSSTAALQLGLVNRVGGGNALQLGAMNLGSSRFRGLQISGFNWTDDVTGIQVAGLNLARDVAGLQVAGLNIASELDGIQVGGLNYAGQASGIQIGVINFARSLNGVQIGALNINLDGIWLTPGVNVGWSGWRGSQYACRQVRDCQ